MEGVANVHVIPPVTVPSLLPSAAADRTDLASPKLRRAAGARQLTHSTQRHAAAFLHWSAQGACERWCVTRERLQLGGAPVEATMGFDVSAHPEAESKVARDMLARLSTDAAEYAQQAVTLTF